MTDYKQLFLDYMDANGVKYTDVREDVVKVVYTGDNLKSIPVYVFFDKDGDPLVCFKCWDIARLNDSKKAYGIIKCNTLNKKYRWVKFYLDDDNDIVAQIDAYVDEKTCGSEYLALVRRMVGIVDEGYALLAAHDQGAW